MRKLVLSIMVICLINSAYSMQIDQQQVLENEAEQKVKIFATELKSVLVEAIQKEGLQGAVAVCSQRAPEIAESLSTEGWTVARTSLKTRNENNQPDNWEKQVMIRFDKHYKAGDEANSLSTSALNGNQFRYMKAIPTGQVCLACHGSSVDPKLINSINGLYPKDTARGFSLDDIRGAFTLTKDIDSTPKP